MQTPQVVDLIVDTFLATTCPYTGWDHTICGTYQTIARAVNQRHNTYYSATDVGVALNWLQENGPGNPAIAAYISKTGPGNRKESLVQFDALSKLPVYVPGSVYMLITNGVYVPKERQRVLLIGQLQWCSYRITGLRHDRANLRQLRASLPASDPSNRRVRQALRRIEKQITDEIALIGTLQNELDLAAA